MSKLINIKKVLNELMSAGYTAGTGSGTTPDYTGFSYSVMPLSFNLQQSGKGIPNIQGYFKFYLGDKVKGISPYNDKEYIGIIKHIYYNEETNDPELVYIQELKNNSVIPIMAKGIKKVK